MIGEHVKAERARLDMTQDELAELLGVSRRTIQRWETGEQVIPVKSQQRIAAALAARTENPLDSYRSVDLLAAVLRRLDPVTQYALIESLVEVIRHLAQSDNATDG